MPHPLVVHLKRDPYDVYVGRGQGSILGNPYSHQAGTLADHQVRTREEAVAMFEGYARIRIANDPRYAEAIRSCYLKRLGCWCAPQLCHAEVIAKLAFELQAEKYPLKVVIAGTRTLSDPRLIEQAVRASGFKPTEVVCGEAQGIDTLGRKWAEDRGIPVASFPADWQTFGKRAGYIRNTRMGDYADAVIAITTGSPGTKHMIDITRSMKKPLWVMNVL